ncbi:MAG: hypothetical protein F6K56_22075 [Moorea sp. SIO3G5]|nr:hypothetical protein [Moorena sp. SIO3G5]
MNLLVKFPLAHPTSSAIARRFSFRCDWPTATLRDQPYRHSCADRTTSQLNINENAIAFGVAYGQSHKRGS